MGPETILVTNDGLCRTVLMLVQGFTLGVGLASILFIFFCLACAVLDSFAPWRRAARRQPAPAPAPPGPDESALLAALAGRKDGRADNLTGGEVGRKSPSILL